EVGVFERQALGRRDDGADRAPALRRPLLRAPEQRLSGLGNDELLDAGRVVADVEAGARADLEDAAARLLHHRLAVRRHLRLGARGQVVRDRRTDPVLEQAHVAAQDDLLWPRLASTTSIATTSAATRTRRSGACAPTTRSSASRASTARRCSGSSPATT